MTTFYCDYEGGNDANAGTSFALRWKTLTNGATAARIAPGDTIRIMASPDPTSLGTTGAWTDGPLPATFAPTSSTNATPIVFTKAGHNLVTGDTVIVNGHTTNTNANGVWNVTVSGDTFTLLNADGSNSVGNGTGGATGTVRKITNAVVTLGSSTLTKNIALFGNSSTKTNWTAATADITNTVFTTDYKEGGECQKIVVGAAFTTGLAAYFATGTLDLSGFQQVSFWIKQTAGTIGANSACSLKLCSDTAGATPVNTVNIPLLGALNQWSPIAVDLATNLGSSIQSIAFYVNTDNGAQTFLLDNIIACKAASSADSISLTSLIGKNTGTEGWYGIQSINGARVVLDQAVNCIPSSAPSRGYSGATESVTTYKRETIKTVMASSGSPSAQSIMDSGTDGLPITFSGGWNRTDMSSLTGDSVFDGQNGFGRGIMGSGNSFITLTGVSLCRYEAGVKSIGQRSILTVKNANNNTYYGIDQQSYHGKTSISIDNANNNGNYGLVVKSNNTITVNNANGNGSIGVTFWGCRNTASIANARNNSGYAIDLSGTIGVYANNNTCVLSDSSGNGTASVLQDTGENYLRNSTLNSTAKVAGFVNNVNSFLWSTNENNDTDTHYGYTDGGLISSDTGTVHTSGMSWKLSPTSANRSATYPLPLKVATAACAANTAITCNVWFRRDNTGLTARLICKGGQLTGIPNDVSSSMTAAADTWEQLSVQVTPTQKGVLEFYAECWGGTTYNLFVDDCSFT